jgi:hypothetical protein
MLTIKTAPAKNCIFGGIIFCALPLIVFFVTRWHHQQLPISVLALLVLFFITGLWMIVPTVLKFNPDGPAYAVASSLFGFGFAAFAFLVAWQEKNGWSGGIPFFPEAWNQVAARSLFAFGGVIGAIFGVLFLRKALKRH